MLTEGELIMSMLGLFCLSVIGLIFLAWIYNDL